MMSRPSKHIRAILLALIAVLALLNTATVVNGNGLLSTGDDPDNLIDTYIKKNDVMVFAKSYCPHCKTSKSIIELLQHETSHFATWTENFLYLDQMDQDGKIIQNALHEKTGQRTVPNIFIGGKHIGGNTDLVNLYQSGELLIMIKEIAISRIKTEL
jgi:glutaredoxin 3